MYLHSTPLLLVVLGAALATVPLLPIAVLALAVVAMAVLSLEIDRSDSSQSESSPYLHASVAVLLTYN